MSGIYSFSRVHLWAVGNCSWEDFSFTVKEKERVLAGSWPNLCSLSLSHRHRYEGESGGSRMHGCISK